MDNIEALKILATKVMGWELRNAEPSPAVLITNPEDRYPYPRLLIGWNGTPAWDPFTRPADAVELAEAMRKRGYDVQIVSGPDETWWASCFGTPLGTHAGTFAHVLTSAILLAVEQEATGG